MNQSRTVSVPGAALPARDSRPGSGFLGSRAFEPLSRRERRGMIGLCVIAVLFGGIVELRSAFLQQRMTDLGVFLRAAWAIRVGANPYAVADDRGWHYHYPPLLAITLGPLADPPSGAEFDSVPFSVSVGIWYVVSLIQLAAGVHVLARALERTSTDPRVRSLSRGCRRWWVLRVVPVLVCLTAIGTSLSRGQTSILVLALLCAMVAAAVQLHRLRAGLWLAGAVCIKVFPAVLAIAPLWRRDWRWLAGLGVGSALTLVLLPAYVLGPTQALRLGQAWTRVVLRPALSEHADRTRSAELYSMTSTGNQSLLALLHNLQYRATKRADRPVGPGSGTRAVHLAIAASFLIATLVAADRAPASPAHVAVAHGLLITAMLFTLPVCFFHYFVFVLPLVMSVLALTLEDRLHPTPRRVFWLLAVVYPFVVVIPDLPGLAVLRPLGLATGVTAALWVSGLLGVILPFETDNARQENDGQSHGIACRTMR